MQAKRFLQLLFVGGVLIVLLACNFPLYTKPPSTEIVPPNFTQTALVEMLWQQATQTFQANNNPIETNTETPMPPSQTSIPTIPSPIPPPSTDIPTAIVEPVHTKAPKPTVSYVGPNHRSGLSVNASYLSTPPTIDGIFDEWNVDRYLAEYVVYGKSNYQDSNDLSASFMLGWDDDYLYIASRIKDDKYVQNASGENLFKGDSIEILIDTIVSNDYYYPRLNNDDFQLGISGGSPNPGDDPEAYLWFPEVYSDSKSGVKIGSTLTGDGYRIEAKIPWDLFKIIPGKGNHFGFAFSVSDNDKTGETFQQTMVSSAPTRTLIDPTTWGDLVLGNP